MKKVFGVILALIMICAAVGCAKTGTEQTAPVDKPAQDAGTTTQQQTQQNPSDGQEVAEPDVIKVGIVNGLNADGTLTYWFSEAGIKIALDEEGNFEGKKVELIFREPGADATVAKQHLSELKEEGCCVIFCSVDDSMGPAVVQWSNENKFPVISSTNYSSEMYLNNNCKYYFNCGFNSWGYAKLFANEAVNKRGYKSYAYIGTDGSACLDANAHFLLEGQKFNPDFKCVADYRLSYTDTEFSTILATVLSMDEVPEMTFQAGGYTVISFLQQSNLYDFFEKSSAWSDVLTISTIVSPLAEAGTYPFGGSYGLSNLAWWQDAFKEHVAKYDAKCLELFGQTYLPHDYELQQYWCMKATLLGIHKCLDEGKDLMDHEAMTEAIAGVSWEDCGSQHSFREFDHQLTYNLFFIDAQDGGAENGHMAVPSDLNAYYAADEWLPSYDEIAEYANANGLTFPNNK